MYKWIDIIWSQTDIPEALDGGFNRSEFNFLLQDRLLAIWEASLTPEQANDAYWAVNYHYTPWPYLEDEDLNRQAFVDVGLDFVDAV